MPIGPQALEDVEERMPSRRPVTLKDPDTPDQLVLDQRSLTHFPGQPWCKVCVERIGYNRQLTPWCHNFSWTSATQKDTGPPQIACFLVGTYTSSGAISATKVPDSWKMDMLHVVGGTPKWVRDLGYERFCLHGDTEGVLQLLSRHSCQIISFRGTRLAHSTTGVTVTEPS